MSGILYSLRDTHLTSDESSVLGLLRTCNMIGFIIFFVLFGKKFVEGDF